MTGFLGSITNGASYVASSITQAAVSTTAYLSLPEPGLYQDEITNLKQSLFDKTGAHIAAETAKVIAYRQIDKLEYYLTNYSSLAPEDAEHGINKNFLYVENGVVYRNITGESFLTVLTNHKDLLLETFELNTLRALNNSITYLLESQRQNSFFVVDLIQDAMKEVTAELGVNTPPVEYNEHEQFMTCLEQACMKILFPHGEDDIEIPVSLQGWINKKAFLTIQEKALPHKLGMLYHKATSEDTKYALLAKAIRKLKKALNDESKASSPSESAPSQIDAVYSKEKSQEFSKNLSDLLLVSIDHINMKSLKLLKPVIPSIIAAASDKIIAQIAKTNLVGYTNKALKRLALHYNSQGSWTTVDEQDRFSYVMMPPRTMQQKRDKKAHAIIHNKAFVDATAATIAQDLRVLVNRLSSHKPQPSEMNQSRIKKVIYAVATFFQKVKKKCINFLFLVFGVDKKITNLSQKIIDFGKELNVELALRPFKRVVIQNYSSL
ncbi:MAG: hypothetical protein LLF94_07045 [Chlamydiales bacterium]|nr:hypothetical protein [Chlamydiales bacterium]